MKTVWKGYLSFGLVNINMQLYSAIEAHPTKFKLLDAKYKSPITYKRWCEQCDHEVDWQDVVKGYQLPDGSYFILTPENLDKLKPAKSNAINITQIVDTDTIAPVYYNRHYYVAPDTNNKAYYLLQHVLKQKQQAAIGQFVMREKEYICLIRPFQDILLLSTLHYAYEIKQLPQVKAVHNKFNSQEIELAENLLDVLYTKKPNLQKYTDTFHEKLIKRIEAAAQGITVEKKAEPIPTITPVPSLINALQESLTSAQAKQLQKHKKQ